MEDDEKAKLSSASPKKYIIALVIFAVIALAVVVSIRYATNTFNPFFVVASDSMVPTLQVGDLILMKHFSDSGDAGSSFKDVKVGDIILFKNPHEVDDETGQPITIIHRVVEINDTAGERIIKTKGDNNPESIADLDYPIYKSYYIGKVAYVIPAVGTLELSPYKNYFLVGMGVAMIATLIFIFRRGKS